MADSSGGRQRPRVPIDRIAEPFERFLHVESASGLVLLAATLVALALANSPFSDAFVEFWKMPVGVQFGDLQLQNKLVHWINDGLMAIFFFVIGLEVKREIVHGELGSLRKAALPIFAAVGGMLVPAGIYLSLHPDGPAARGWGIPMATDIAFVVGCLALLGSRVPHTLRLLLISVAIADDIGAILVIAIGYTASIGFTALALGGVGVVAIALLARLGVRSLLVYWLLGLLVWLAFHESGVHATIAGVILGLMTPARAYLSDTSLAQAFSRLGDTLSGEPEAPTPGAAEVRGALRAARETVSPLEYLEKTLHPWVSFVIVPLFALANAGVPFSSAQLADPIAVAVVLGLVVGKPLGIVSFSFIAIRSGLASLPRGVSWTMLLAGGALSGIGFTMALFISGLALGRDAFGAKVGVLAASAIAAALGMLLMTRVLPKSQEVAARVD